MTTRLVRLALSLVAVAVALPAFAQGFDPLGGLAREIKRRQCWPKPFVCPDREAVRAPFCVMVANGWQRQNTLGFPHFEEGTGQLTEVGRLRVDWILLQAPEQHRGIYVYRAPTSEETVARIAAIQQHAVRILPPGEAPMVMPTDIPPPTSPGDRIDSVGRKFRDGTPKPVLPDDTSSHFK